MVAVLVGLVGLAACGRARSAAPRDAAVPMGADAAAAVEPPVAAPLGDLDNGGNKHMTFAVDLDGGTVLVEHKEMQWGDYLDRQGRPAVGWHSHDPATGNAQ